MSNTPNLLLPEIAESQSQKYLTHNLSLATLDALVQLAVVDKDLTAPPASPADGSCYIPAATATGAWVGKENYIAYYDYNAWKFFSPKPGWLAFVIDEAKYYYYDGSAWSSAFTPA